MVVHEESGFVYPQTGKKSILGRHDATEYSQPPKTETLDSKMIREHVLDEITGSDHNSDSDQTGTARRGRRRKT